MKILKSLCAVMLVFVLAGCGLFQNGDPNLKLNKDSYSGYISSCEYSDGYCLLTSDGNIEYFSSIGKFEKLIFENKTGQKMLDIASFNDCLVVSGKAGTLFLIKDGQSFISIAGEYEDNDFVAVSSADKGVVVGCGNGKIIAIDLSKEKYEYSFFDTKLEMPIISVASSKGTYAGITENGYGVVINNGNIVTHKMSEFYPGEYRLNSIISGSDFYSVCGIQTDNSTAVVFTSDNGNIWMKKSIEFFEDKKIDFPVPLELYDIVYDGEQFVCAANNGNLVTIPDCAKCNKLTEMISGQAYTVCTNKKSIIIAGQDKSVKVVPTDEIRQSNISSETVKDYLKKGAALIDVRSEEDYTAGHIEGAINIPLEKLDDKLPELVPDKNRIIVFYCAMGVRSASACEKALSLGYVHSYSMGAMSNWK